MFSAPVEGGDPGPLEVIHRPEPGLARGVYEAPSWVFLVMAILLGVGVVSVVVVPLRKHLRKRNRRTRRTA